MESNIKLLHYVSWWLYFLVTLVLICNLRMLKSIFLENNFLQDSRFELTKRTGTKKIDISMSRELKIALHV